MRFQLHHFRLLALLVATLVLIIPVVATRVAKWAWDSLVIDEWRRGTESHEAFLTYLVKRKLWEPFAPIDSTVKRFVKPDMDEAGFIHYLQAEGPKQPLIAAGFVWHRDVDSLTVYPNSADIDTLSRRLLHKYISMDYDLDLNTPVQRPFWVYDSLKAQEKVIHSRIGYKLYTYDFQDERLHRRERAAAHKVVLGVVWNDQYYRDKLLPELTRQISADSRAYGILPGSFLRGIEYWDEGILIADASGDTLFTLGRVSTKSDTIGAELFQGLTPSGSWWTNLGDNLNWAPGWRVYVQDRWNLPLMRELWKVRKERLFQETEGLESIPMTERYIITTHHPGMKRLFVNSLFWFVLGIGIFFLVIIGEIRSRNRQRDFIAHVSHELRTPVAKVKLFAETLRHDRMVSEAKENEYLDTILRESDHLAVLVDNTLNLARLDAGKLKVKCQPTDIGEYLTRFCEEQRPALTAAGFELKMQIPEHLSRVNLDCETMELALRNIVDNALKYSGDGREIVISATMKEAKRVLLSVADRGIGIPPSKRRAVFRRFYRIKAADREPVGGAGVGLSLVKEIVRAHHGRVWCEGREGGGTTFNITIPSIGH